MKKFLTELANYKLRQEKWWNTGKWYSNKNSERKFRGTCWYFHENINFCIENLIFPSDLKVADVRQLSKRNQRLQKITAEPLAFYLKDLKYIKCLYNQIQNYFHEILYKNQSGFRKGFNAQHSLVSMMEKWKESVENGRVFGTLNFWLLIS